MGSCAWNWLEDVCDDLSLSWDADFSRRVRDKLVISYDKLDELRFMLSHHRVGKRLVPRTWVINPWTGSRINLPPADPPAQWRSGLGETRVCHAGALRSDHGQDRQGRATQLLSNGRASVRSRPGTRAAQGRQQRGSAHQRAGRRRHWRRQAVHDARREQHRPVLSRRNLRRERKEPQHDRDLNHR